MEKIDNFFIDRIFQPVADWLQDLTRRSSYYLAAYCCAGVSLTSLLVAYLQFGESILQTVLSFGCSLISISMARAQMKKDDDLYERPSKSIDNDRLDPVLLVCRPILAVMFLAIDIPFIIKKVYSNTFTLTDGIGEIFSIFLLAAFYFAACTPKPPAPKKQKVPDPTPA